MHPFVIALSAIAIFLGACGRCGGPTQAAVDPATRALFEAAAADALATVVIRPARWSAFRDALAPVLPDRLRDTVQKADSPLAFVDLLTDAGISVDALPDLDTAAPFALGLYVTPPEDLIEAMLALTDASAKGLMTLHNRVILPARDAPKLAEELRAVLHGHGIEMVDEPEPHGRVFVAIFAEGDHVRVEVVTDDVPPTGGPSAAWRARWKERLAKLPHAELAPTAGLQLATSGTPFAAALVQSTLLRRTHAAASAGVVASALASVEADLRSTLLSVGVAEVMGGYPLLANEHALVHDIGAQLDGEHGLSFVTVTSLTAGGEKLFSAASQAAVPVPEPGEGFARGAMRLSMRALASQLELPPSISQASRQDLAEIMLECGAFCRLSLGGTLGIMKHLLDDEPHALQALPHAASFVATAPDGGGGRPSLALALAYPRGQGIPDDALQRLQGELPRGLAIESDTTGDPTLTYVGFGVSPKAAFGPARAGPLFAFELDLDALGHALERADITSLPPHLGTLVARTDLSGPALVSSLVLAPKRVEPLPAAFDGSDFSAPPAAPETPGAACLEKAVLALARGWKSAGNAAPDQRTLVMAQAGADAEASLACAESDPATRPDATRLRALARVFGK